MRWSQCMLVGTAHRERPALMNCSLITRVTKVKTLHQKQIQYIQSHPVKQRDQEQLRIIWSNNILGRSILHCNSLRRELQVAFSSDLSSSRQTLLRVIQMTVQYFFSQCQWSVVQKLPNALQLFNKLTIRRSDRGTVLFVRGRVRC